MQSLRQEHEPEAPSPLMGNFLKNMFWYSVWQVYYKASCTLLYAVHCLFLASHKHIEARCTIRVLPSAPSMKHCLLRFRLAQNGMNNSTWTTDHQHCSIVQGIYEEVSQAVMRCKPADQRVQAKHITCSPKSGYLIKPPMVP